MEELLAFALLLSQKLTEENEYQKRLDAMFLDNPENDDLLYLEWETDINKAILYINTHIDCTTWNCELFGQLLMEKLKIYYKNCADMKLFGDKIYSLWDCLPGHIQNKDPFYSMCYANDPLSYGNENQSREIYKSIMDYYRS